MPLESSCHCRAVSFAVEPAHPYPFNPCHCSIFRKAANGGGATINPGTRFEGLGLIS